MAKKKAVQPQEEYSPVSIEGDADDAFDTLFGAELTHPTSVPVVEVEVISQGLEPPAEESQESSMELDAYLRNQVYREMYGTEQPTAHERTLLALKERL